MQVTQCFGQPAQLTMYTRAVTILFILGTFKLIPDTAGETAIRITQPGLRITSNNGERRKEHKLVHGITNLNHVQRTSPLLVEITQPFSGVRSYPVQFQRAEPSLDSRKSVPFPQRVQELKISNSSPVPKHYSYNSEIGKESFLGPTNPFPEPDTPRIIVSQEGLDSDLFWSYYNSGSVNKATTGQSGYDRLSPSSWVGASGD